MKPETVAKWRKTMEEVGSDGLTGYQRRGQAIRTAKLARDSDYYKKWSDKTLNTLGSEGLKKRGAAIKKSLIDNGTMETRNANAAAAIRAKMRPVNEVKSLKRYRNRVATLSRKHDLSDLPNFDLWGEKGGYELDHKYSVSEGWKNQIAPEILAAKHNLQFIDKISNVRKGSRCDITLEELLSW